VCARTRARTRVHTLARTYTCTGTQFVNVRVRAHVHTQIRTIAHAHTCASTQHVHVRARNTHTHIHTHLCIHTYALVRSMPAHTHTNTYAHYRHSTNHIGAEYLWVFVRILRAIFEIVTRKTVTRQPLPCHCGCHYLQNWELNTCNYSRIFRANMYMLHTSACVCMFNCVYVRVRAHTHIGVYVYVCLCVCMFVQGGEDP